MWDFKFIFLFCLDVFIFLNKKKESMVYGNVDEYVFSEGIVVGGDSDEEIEVIVVEVFV